MELSSPRLSKSALNSREQQGTAALLRQTRTVQSSTGVTAQLAQSSTTGLPA